MVIKERQALRQPLSSIPRKFNDFGSWALRDYFITAASFYEVDYNLALKIMLCESGGNYKAKNGGSTASGLFQFIKGTWAGTPQGRAGRDVFDPYANINGAFWLLSQPNGLNHWNETRSCWQ